MKSRAFSKSNMATLKTEPNQQSKTHLDLNKLNLKQQHYEQVKQLNLTKIQQKINRPKESIPTFSQQKQISDWEFLQRSQNQQIIKQQYMKAAQEQAIAKSIAKDFEGVTFHPQVSKYASEKFKDRKRTGSQFYESGVTWLKDKAQYLEYEREKLLEIKNAAPFKPQVNRNDFVKGDFYERLMEKEQNKRQKLEKVKKELTPSFKPKINNKSLHIQSTLSKEYLMNKNETSAFDQVRKMHEMEHSQAMVVQQSENYETQDQAFGETSQVSANNSFLNLLKNMKHKSHTPNLKKYSQNLTINDQSLNHGSTSFTIGIEEPSAEIKLFQNPPLICQNPPPLLIQDGSPHFNMQSTVKKVSKPVDTDQQDFSEMMYDFLAQDEEEDDECF